MERHETCADWLLCIHAHLLLQPRSVVYRATRRHVSCLSNLRANERLEVSSRGPTGETLGDQGSGAACRDRQPAELPLSEVVGVGFTRPAPAYFGSEVKNSPPCFIRFGDDRRL